MVARPVEHDRRDVVRPTSERLGDRGDVLRQRFQQVDRPAGARPDRHLPHVHVREVQERAAVADGDHRHRTVPAARDDAAALERVDREVDGRAAGADVLAGAQRRVLVGRADHDPSLDLEVVERAPHRVGRLLLSRLVVRAAQPARSGQRGPLRRARIRLAQARRTLRLGLGLDRFGDGLFDRAGHQTFCTCSAPSSTSSITLPIAASMFEFSITGTL